MRFFWGLVWIAIATGVIKYTYQIVQTFGQVPWAERNLGSGGTYTMWKIVGIIIILIAFFYMFGGMDILSKPLDTVF